MVGAQSGRDQAEGRSDIGRERRMGNNGPWARRRRDAADGNWRKVGDWLEINTPLSDI